MVDRNLEVERYSGISEFREKYTQFACMLRVSTVSILCKSSCASGEDKLVFNCRHITCESDTVSWGRKL